MERKSDPSMAEPAKGRSMAAAAAAGGGRDRLSDLPYDVRGSILSLLSDEEAARTALLSSQWRHLWSNSPLYLNFNRFMGGHVASMLADVLSRHSAPARLVRIQNLVLSEMERASLASLYQALQGKHIQNLQYHGILSSPDATLLPQCLISDGSLVELLMEHCWFQDPTAALLSLRHLKDLRMLLIPNEDGKDFGAVISGLPMLETLRLSYLHNLSDFHIKSRSLERLFLTGLDGEKLTIDAPNLQELGLSSMPTSWINLYDVVSRHSKIRYLRLEYLKDVTSLHICSIGLQRLYLDKVSPLQDPVIHAPNLTVLIVSRIDISGEYLEKMLLRFPMLCSLKIVGPVHFAKFHLTSETLRNIFIHDVQIMEDFLIDAPSLQKVYIDPSTFECVNVKFLNSQRIADLGCLYSHPQMLELGDAIFKDVDFTCDNPILGIKKLTINVCNAAPLVTRPYKFLNSFPCLETLHIREVEEDLEIGEGDQEDLRHEKEGGHLLNHLMSFKLDLFYCRKSTLHLVQFIISQAKSLQKMHFYPGPHLKGKQQYLEFVSDIRALVDPEIIREFLGARP